MASAHLTWTESHGGVSHVDQYLIYRGVNGGALELLATFQVERDMFGGRTNALAYTDEGLSNANTYQYEIVGRPVQGPDSAPSNRLSLP